MSLPPRHPLEPTDPFLAAVRSLPASTVAAIWAQSTDAIIGRGGTMPWRAPEDMANFASLTWGSPVVMGRRTWDSVPPTFRPFASRTSIVVTGSREAAAAVGHESRPQAAAEAATSLSAAIQRGQTLAPDGVTWVAGGGRVYAAALAAGLVDAAVVTVLDIQVPDGDTPAPTLPAAFTLVAASPTTGFHPSAKGPGYRFELHRKVS